MRIHTMCFTLTDTTKKVTSAIATKKIRRIWVDRTNQISLILRCPKVETNKPVSFAKEDAVIVGVPVYAGRVPNVLLKYLNSTIGYDALAVAVVVHGNRHYDDALIELVDILTETGFRVIAGGAFIGEHSFSKTLAKDRPDVKDIVIASDFASKVCKKLNSPDRDAITVNGNRPYKKYYMPNYDDEGYLRHKHELEVNFQCRRELELFV